MGGTNADYVENHFSDALILQPMPVAIVSGRCCTAFLPACALAKRS